MKSRSGGAQSPSDMARPRTGNEDIHQPLGALLPVGTRSHVGHSDKCPQQIEWLDIFAYVAALDCALHQPSNAAPGTDPNAAGNARA